jgi:flagellar hook-associated protein 3 FlgL
MLKGIGADNYAFVTNLNNIENQINVTTQQISSGIDVNQASDNPAAVGPILSLQSAIDRVTQVQTNLSTANAVANTADSALQSANSIVNQLTTIAAQGATGTTSATTMTSLAQQVGELEQQLVSIADTSVQGSYIFGGDNQSIAPYTFDGINPPVAGVANPTNTGVITDADGNSIVPIPTAQQIFDSPAGSLLQAVDSLRVALQTDNQAGVTTAASSLSTGATQLNLGAQTVGATEDWISNATTTASQLLTTLKSQLSGLRDTDVAAASTQLTLHQTAYEAAISAQANLPTKTLFDFMG